jgi:ferrochelatase
LEILYDLDVAAKEYANSLGIALARVSSLNDDAMFIEALAAVVRPLLTKGLTVAA